METSLFRRMIKDKIFLTAVFFLSLATVIPLFLILLYIFNNGFSAVNWKFLTALPRPAGEPGGGIFNAMLGTAILVLLACLFAVLPGIAVGLYLAEFRDSKLAGWVRISAGVLMGIPSIVIGIIAYLWIVKPLKSFSAVSGSVALGIMMMPVVIQATEESIKRIPDSLKEASLALGVPYEKTVLKVILPAGLSGIATGVLLGIARIAGETAPLLFTAFGNPYLSWNLLKPVHSLSLLIFNYAVSPYPDWHQQAWGASLVLILPILILNLIAKVWIKRWKVQF